LSPEGRARAFQALHIIAGAGIDLDIIPVIAGEILHGRLGQTLRGPLAHIVMAPHAGGTRSTASPRRAASTRSFLFKGFLLNNRAAWASLPGFSLRFAQAAR